MADRFEREMNKKMEELTITPSEEVWQHIEKKINENHRKKKPLWLFLIPVLLISGLAILIYSSGPDLPETIRMIENESVKIDSLKNIESEKVVRQRSLTNHAENENSETITGSSTTVLPNREDHPMYGNRRVNKQESHSDATGKNEEFENTDRTKRSYATTDDSSSIGDSTEIVQSQQSTPGDSVVTKTFLTSDPLLPDKNSYQKSTKGWTVILELSPGISTTGNLFSTAKSTALLMENSTVEPVPGYPSLTDVELKSSVGIEADLLLKKSIGKKLGFSTGLQYQYFTIAGRLTQSRQYGNFNRPFELSYTDQFHYLGIPLNLYFDNRQTLPFSLRAGISFNYLLGNASTMPIDSAGLKMDRHLTKINAGFHGALLFDIVGTRQFKMQAGPYVYSSFKPIAATGVYKDGHFTFLGLKATFSLHNP